MQIFIERWKIWTFLYVICSQNWFGEYPIGQIAVFLFSLISAIVFYLLPESSTGLFLTIAKKNVSLMLYIIRPYLCTFKCKSRPTYLHVRMSCSITRLKRSRVLWCPLYKKMAKLGVDAHQEIEEVLEFIRVCISNITTSD